jgi:hypothetical protein
MIVGNMRKAAIDWQGGMRALIVYIEPAVRGASAIKHWPRMVIDRSRLHTGPRPRRDLEVGGSNRGTDGKSNKHGICTSRHVLYLKHLVVII